MEKIFAEQLKKSKDEFETSTYNVINCLKYRENHEECRKKVRQFNHDLVNYDDMHETYFGVLDDVLDKTRQQFDDKLEKNYPHMELVDMVNLPEKLAKLKTDYSDHSKQYLATKKKAEEFKEKMVKALSQTCVQENSSYWRSCQDLNQTAKQLDSSIKRIDKTQAQNEKAPYISTLESLLVSQKFFDTYNRAIEEQRIEKQNEELLTQYSPF